MNPEENLELAAKLLDHCHRNDRVFMDIRDKIQRRLGPPDPLSGLSNGEYSTIEQLGLGSNIDNVIASPPRPLPQEIVDQFANMQYNCGMGLFPSISRAWISIDSNLYVWNYQTGTDLAFYDGMNQAISLCALVKPKPGVFKQETRLLLAIASITEIALLAVSFIDSQTGALIEDGVDFGNAEMNVLPEAVFRLPLNGTIVSAIESTEDGRIFFAGRDGCLYELDYRDKTWFRGATCSKINHSKGLMSYLVPSFVQFAFGKDEPIAQIAADPSRHILYIRTENGGIQVFDLGNDGKDLSHFASVSSDHILSWSTRLAVNIESNIFKQIISITPIRSSWSNELSLIATTAAGARLYFSLYYQQQLDHQQQQQHNNGGGGCGLNQGAVRPKTIRLVHIRLPPGFTPISTVPRPSNVHLALDRKEFSLHLSSANEENDVLWIQSSSSFPFYPGMAEIHKQIPLKGRSWCIVEHCSGTGAEASFMSEEAVMSDWIRQNPQTTPPLLPSLLIRQHTMEPARIHILSSQGVQSVEILRPVDILRRILLEYGPDSSQTKRFFDLHKAENACVMCLILVCSSAVQERQLGLTDSAMRAFFLFGGEAVPLMNNPNLYSNNINNNNRNSNATTADGFNNTIGNVSQFSPQVVSTPTQSPRDHDHHQQHFAGGGGNTSGFNHSVSGPFHHSVGGGEGDHYYHQQGGMPTTASTGGSSVVTPLTSTLIMPTAADQQQMQSGHQNGTSIMRRGAGSNAVEILYSARHNSLYLHLSRIIGQLWHMRLVNEDLSASPNAEDPLLRSSFGSEELGWLATQIERLTEVVREQSLVPSVVPLASAAAVVVGAPSSSSSSGSGNVQNRMLSFYNSKHASGAINGASGDGGQDSAKVILARRNAEAANVERESLIRLCEWMTRSSEVLHLWRILSEHQFHVLASRLPLQLRSLLRRITFRHIIMGGKAICLDLITCLMSQYMSDYATTEVISKRLRQVCPGLYTTDDATASKAHELVQSARTMVNEEEKSTTLRDAIELYKKVVNQIHLPTIAKQLQEVDCFDGIVDLALCGAAKADPENLAVAYYLNVAGGGQDTAVLGNQGPPDFLEQMKTLYTTRMSYYQCITNLLNSLMDAGTTMKDPRMNLATLELVSENILKECIKSSDELCHVAIYDWLISRGLSKKLIHIKSDYLEGYLQRRVSYLKESSAAGGTSTKVGDDLMDLMWAYYERQENFLHAAKLLQQLSERHSTSMSLEMRLKYLARALSCAKSAPSTSDHASVYIQELEDKLDVAHIQKQIYDALNALLLTGSGSLEMNKTIREALSRLSSEMLEVSSLYADYAEEFGLCECKLAVVHIAGYNDDKLVQQLWQEIIDKELAMSRNDSADVRSRKLGQKLTTLSRLYSNSSRYFPIDYLISELEEASSKNDFPPDWLPNVLLEMGIKFDVILEKLNTIYQSYTGNRRHSNGQSRLLQSLLVLFNSLLNTQTANSSATTTASSSTSFKTYQQLNSLSTQQKRRLSSKCLDSIACYLIELQCLPDTVENVRLTRGFQGSQIQFKRLQASSFA